MGGVGKFFGGLVGSLFGSKRSSNTVVTQEPGAVQAPPPAEAPAPVETTSRTNELKKKARGKSALTINSGSSSGGTGINV